MSRVPSSTILKNIDDSPTRKALEQILRFIHNTSTPAETSSGGGGYINISGGSSSTSSSSTSGDYVTLDTPQQITGLKTLVCDTEALDPFLIVQDLNGGGDIPFLFESSDRTGGVIIFPAPSHEQPTKLMQNPMGDPGSLIIGGAGGAPYPLAIGSPGQFLSVGPQGNLVWSDNFTLMGSATKGVSINREAVTANRELIVPDFDVDLNDVTTLSTEQELTGIKTLHVPTEINFIKIRDINTGAIGVFCCSNPLYDNQTFIIPTPNSGGGGTETFMMTPWTSNGAGSILTEGTTTGFPVSISPGNEGDILTIVDGVPTWVAPS
jgi:hypothetical protein